MSSEQTFNHNKSRRKTRKRDKVNSNKEKKDNKVKEEKQSQKRKLPLPIIYDPDKNQRNMLLVVDDNSFNQGQEQITTEAKEMINYYLEFHKNMINTYNAVYSQILQNKVDLSWDVFFYGAERFTNYLFEIKNLHTNLISNRDRSLKLVDKIITENLDTFIKSIELTQKFYNDIIQSYLNCMKKS